LILRHPGLGALYFNALLFSGCVMSPLMVVLMLEDLGLAPWQYGLSPGDCRAWAVYWARA
jgi:hypothetical protein